MVGIDFVEVKSWIQGRSIIKFSQVSEIKLAGRHIAYYRGTDKIVYAVAAYCPHMGSNLGVGG